MLIKKIGNANTNRAHGDVNRKAYPQSISKLFHKYCVPTHILTLIEC